MRKTAFAVPIFCAVRPRVKRYKGTSGATGRSFYRIFCILDGNGDLVAVSCPIFKNYDTDVKNRGGNIRIECMEIWKGCGEVRLREQSFPGVAASAIIALFGMAVVLILVHIVHRRGRLLFHLF